MRKQVNRLTVLIFTLVLAAGMLLPAGTVYATETAANDTAASTPMLDEMAKQLQDMNKDPFGYRSDKTAQKKTLRASKSIPEKYDLRNADTDGDGEGDTNLVTPVKFQNPFGTCWGFASIASAETSILADNLAEGYAATADEAAGIKQLDLSEKHLVNFVYMPINDPSNSQNGEGIYFKYENMTPMDKFNMGGFGIFATSLFASGMGPNLEDRALPSAAPAGTPADIYEYHGINKDVDKRKVNGVWQNYCYSANDDWGMDEGLRFSQSYVLKESYLLPSPAEVESNMETGELTYTYNPQGTEAIKSLLLQNRAVNIGFYADGSYPDQEAATDYISPQWAHYTYEPKEYANHEVSIIGYDDNYDKENFRHQVLDPNYTEEDTIPPENGAWLVKNSWGSEEEVFPNKGPGWGIENDEGQHTGYFWLSYYDQSLKQPEALAFDKSNVGKQYYLDQYDYMPVEDVLTADLPEETSMSNVFQAEVSQQLEQIACQTSAPGSKAFYKIYLLPDKFKNPEDGMCVAEGESEAFAYGGFHKIQLQEPVPIQKGQYYSVVITQVTPDNEYNVNIQIGFQKEVAVDLMDQDYYHVGVINPGESFVKVDGVWKDYSSSEFQEYVLGQFYQIYALDNLPIKGFCTERPNLNLVIQQGNSINLKPAGPDSASLLTAAFRGSADNLPPNAEIEWEVSEGSEEIFDFIVDPDNSARAQVTAIKPGKGYVKVSAEGVGTEVVCVNVSKSGKYQLDEWGLEYGEKAPIDVYDYEGNQVPNSELIFKSLDTKVVKVNEKGVMTAVGAGKTKVSVSDATGAEDFLKVTVKKADNPMVVKGKTKIVKASLLKKGKVTVKRTDVLKITNAKGTRTYFKMSGPKKISIAKKTGKVTVMKGLPKGTYTVKVKVKAAGTKNYKAKSLIRTFKIKVK